VAYGLHQPSLMKSGHSGLPNNQGKTGDLFLRRCAKKQSGVARNPFGLPRKVAETFRA
jgi:hypothetical protein